MLEEALVLNGGGAENFYLVWMKRVNVYATIVENTDTFQIDCPEEKRPDEKKRAWEECSQITLLEVDRISVF